MFANRIFSDSSLQKRCLVNLKVVREGGNEAPHGSDQFEIGCSAIEGEAVTGTGEIPGASSCKAIGTRGSLTVAHSFVLWVVRYSSLFIFCGLRSIVLGVASTG